MTTTVHHARPGRLRDWLPRRRQRTAPVVTAVHGATLAEPLKTDYIITGSHAVPAPDLVQRTVPASVKTTPATGTTTGYDTQPFSIADEQPGPDQPQRIPGSSGQQPLVPVEPLADAGLLERVRDGVLNMDGAPAVPVPFGGSWLVVRTSSEMDRCTPDRLAGCPQFAGTRPAPDGTPYAVIYLADPNPDAPEPGDRFAIDSADAVYLVALRAAVDEAISALTMGSPVVEQTGGAQ